MAEDRTRRLDPRLGFVGLVLIVLGAPAIAAETEVPVVGGWCVLDGLHTETGANASLAAGAGDIAPLPELPTGARDDGPRFGGTDRALRTQADPETPDR